MNRSPLPWCAVLLLACSTNTGDRTNELRIEMRPVNSILFGGLFEPVVEGQLVATDEVAFAWHDDYPAAVEVGIGAPWSTCAQLVGRFIIDEITTSDPSLEVVAVGEDRFRIAPAREGEFTALVRGGFIPDSADPGCAGLSSNFEITVSVPVRRPVGVRVDRPDACEAADRFRVETDARLGPFLSLELVDAAGVGFRPSNATSSHPATVVLTADAATELALSDEDEGLAALVVSGAPGEVELSAFDAPQEVIEHVAPADIDVVGAQFELLGFGGGPTMLADGEVYGDTGWGRTSASIGVASSGLVVDGEPVCTLPRPGAFALTSSTPQTCVAYAELGHGDGPYGTSFGDAVIEVSAEVIASGVCTLELAGDDYSGGDGFATALSVEILNAEGLIRAGEGR